LLTLVRKKVIIVVIAAIHVVAVGFIQIKSVWSLEESVHFEIRFILIFFKEVTLWADLSLVLKQLCLCFNWIVLVVLYLHPEASHQDNLQQQQKGMKNEQVFSINYCKIMDK